MICMPAKPGYQKIEVKTYVKAKSCFSLSVSEELRYARRFLEFCEIIYVTLGRLYLTVDRSEFILGAGDVLVIPRYRTVEGLKPSAEKTTYYSVEFTCSSELLSGIAERVVSVTEDELFFAKLFERLRAAMTGSGIDYEADAALFSILCDIRRGGDRTEQERFSALGAVMEYINRSIDRMITVEEIAAHFGYNKDYLMRIFRMRYGVTMKKYINDQKLTMAKHLLMTTDVSVQKIGESVGLPERELFEKYFKYHEKVTPQRFRKMHR
ncbi:MAG: helix-turn-helix transcriptional regulator [Clostridia bacterium]|nr:helix-turn-helix transcriptional regulator [Clostridia bacterium]